MPVRTPHGPRPSLCFAQCSCPAPAPTSPLPTFQSAGGVRALSGVQRLSDDAQEDKRKTGFENRVLPAALSSFRSFHEYMDSFTIYGSNTVHKENLDCLRARNLTVVRSRQLRARRRAHISIYPGNEEAAGSSGSGLRLVDAGVDTAVLTLKLKGSEQHSSPTMESPFDRPSTLRTVRMAAVALPLPSSRVISQLLLESDPSRLPAPNVAVYAFLWHPWTSSPRLYLRILNYNMPPHI
ncbi:hypothetical protein BDN71DRAFT_1510153 [Pleurotus eryngii]|uniref:Uncharacterized protein n=1 Tax=Pleurotus eryngii TaxID=5323 RepID=A0A9P6D5B0_PLEER|nr:hypothetical protein BDN71DRAFT_1510153 [Pleurotus eryngii]